MKVDNIISGKIKTPNGQVYHLEVNAGYDGMYLVSVENAASEGSYLIHLGDNYTSAVKAYTDAVDSLVSRNEIHLWYYDDVITI